MALLPRYAVTSALAAAFVGALWISAATIFADRPVSAIGMLALASWLASDAAWFACIASETLTHRVAAVEVIHEALRAFRKENVPVVKAFGAKKDVLEALGRIEEANNVISNAVHRKHRIATNIAVAVIWVTSLSTAGAKHLTSSPKKNLARQTGGDSNEQGEAHVHVTKTGNMDDGCPPCPCPETVTKTTTETEKTEKTTKTITTTVTTTTAANCNPEDANQKDDDVLIPVTDPVPVNKNILNHDTIKKDYDYVIPVT